MKCPVCGKRFPVLYQTIWTYKRGGNYLCSYDCMRRYDKGEIGMEQKITKEMREEAVRIALKGGNYLKYLRECGSGNPSAHWALIKKKMMKNDPETYEKLAKLTVRKKLVETPEGEFTPATVKIDGPIRIETPEKIYDIPEPPKPSAFKYKVTGITTEVGEFWIVSGGKIKWIPGRLGKEDPVLQVMMTTTEPALDPENWRKFAGIIMDVIDLLEVET